jgi:hypothetical protein
MGLHCEIGYPQKAVDRTQATLPLPSQLRRDCRMMPGGSLCLYRDDGPILKLHTERFPRSLGTAADPRLDNPYFAKWASACTRVRGHEAHVSKHWLFIGKVGRRILGVCLSGSLCFGGIVEGEQAFWF